jgi:hypothetical protein
MSEQFSALNRNRNNSLPPQITPQTTPPPPNLAALVARAALSFDAKAKRTLLSAFLLYHTTILLDAAYGFWREGVVDELSCGCHLIMAAVIGLFLYLGTRRAHRMSPRKRG